jgi:cytosine deaminase
MAWDPGLRPGDRPARLVRATLPVALCPALGPAAEGADHVRADIALADGRIAAIVPVDAGAPAEGTDLDEGLVFPAFADVHTHLDKGHIWRRAPNPDGSFAGALDACEADRTAHWTADDVRRRMEFSLRCAEAHGTRLIRTHLDSKPPQHRISWPVFAAVREAWRGRIELQGVALLAIDELPEGAALDEYVRLVAEHGGILGAVTYPMPDLDARLARLFAVAARYGLDLDFHSDETTDAAADGLRRIAETSLSTGFPGRVTVGHACSLSVQTDADAMRTLDLVARAGLSVVTLPLCNLYLQGREAGRTPRLRGVTLVHEMRARDIPVAIASDNTRDPFYAYGDLDMLEVFRAATRILHLDHPFADWSAAVTGVPAAIMGDPSRGRLEVGAPADLVLFRARSFGELLARSQDDRIVLRDGVVLERAVPDYRELDER